MFKIVIANLVSHYEGVTTVEQFFSCELLFIHYLPYQFIYYSSDIYFAAPNFYQKILLIFILNLNLNALRPLKFQRNEMKLFHSTDFMSCKLCGQRKPPRVMLPLQYKVKLINLEGILSTQI